MSSSESSGRAKLRSGSHHSSTSSPVPKELSRVDSEAESNTHLDATTTLSCLSLFRFHCANNHNTSSSASSSSSQHNSHLSPSKMTQKQQHMSLKRMTHGRVPLLAATLAVFLLLVGGAWGCGYPGSPAHASVSFSTERIEPGTVATYTCDNGYELIGPPRKTCQANETWTPAWIPFCGMYPSHRLATRIT